jgi:hypothetical protein
LLRIEFKKKGVVVVNDFPYQKAANGKEGTWNVVLKKSESSPVVLFELVFNDEINSFVGFAEGKGTLFNWKGKLLEIVDIKGCKFEFRAD